MREKHRDRRTQEHASGGAAKDKLAKARMTIGPHHQEIGIAQRQMRLKHGGDIAARGVDFVKNNVDAMTCQMLRKLSSRTPAGKHFLRGAGHPTAGTGLF